MVMDWTLLLALHCNECSIKRCSQTLQAKLLTNFHLNFAMGSLYYHVYKNGPLISFPVRLKSTLFSVVHWEDVNFAAMKQWRHLSTLQWKVHFITAVTDGAILLLQQNWHNFLMASLFGFIVNEKCKCSEICHSNCKECRTILVLRHAAPLPWAAHCDAHWSTEPTY